MKKFGSIFLALTLAAGVASAAELTQTNRPVVNDTNFEPNLPILFLQTTQRIPSEVKVPCGVGMVLPSEAKSGKTNTLPGLVRIHGASSQRYAKKSLGLSLDAPMRWLGLRESRSWVLNAAFVDRSLMRHKLSYDLFRSLSVSNAPRFASASRFVEVNLNGRYHGVFLLMERVDRALLELRRYDSNAASQACIYKAVDHAANFSQPGHPGYEQREPEPEVREYWGPMDEFNQFVSSATDTDFFHPETGVASRLDVDNAMDFHLLVLLTSNMDGIDKNFIIARDAPTPATPKPRFFFAPWDYDATFGRNWEASRVEPTAWQSNHLLDRLLSHQDYRKKFAARWQQLRNHQFSITNIERLMDENARTLGSAVRRNEARWKTLTGPYPDRLTFEGDLKEMKEWTAARLESLDQEITRRCRVPAAGR